MLARSWHRERTTCSTSFQTSNLYLTSMRHRIKSITIATGGLTTIRSPSSGTYPLVCSLTHQWVLSAKVMRRHGVYVSTIRTTLVLSLSLVMQGKLSTSISCSRSRSLRPFAWVTPMRFNSSYCGTMRRRWSKMACFSTSSISFGSMRASWCSSTSVTCSAMQSVATQIRITPLFNWTRINQSFQLIRMETWWLLRTTKLIKAGTKKRPQSRSGKSWARASPIFLKKFWTMMVTTAVLSPSIQSSKY